MTQCRYVWERRTGHRRYVNNRGSCKRNATADCNRCSVHCDAGRDCEHYTRWLKRRGLSR